MRTLSRLRRPEWRWGIAGSVVLHGLVAAILLFDLSLPQPRPAEQEEAIEVELVEPEPEDEVQPQAEEEPAALAPQPEEPTEPEPEEEQVPAPEEEPAPALPDETAEAPEPQTPVPETEARPDLPSIRALRPVFEFGEEDTGSEMSEDGNASREAGEPVEETKTDEQEPAAEASSDAPPAEPLTAAETLYSQRETGDVFATTAMANMPRSDRAGELCATELREQLRRTTPSYRPELLPSYRLPSGNVMEVRTGAFRAGGAWYDLSFRCEVDGEATRVVSFAFDVGDPIPRDQWQSRGFPSF